MSKINIYNELPFSMVVQCPPSTPWIYTPVIQIDSCNLGGGGGIIFLYFYNFMAIETYDLEHLFIPYVTLTDINTPLFL